MRNITRFKKVGLQQLYCDSSYLTLRMTCKASTTM